LGVCGLLIAQLEQSPRIAPADFKPVIFADLAGVESSSAWSCTRRA